LVAPIKSNDFRPPRAGGARTSIVVGLLSLATIPGAIAATHYSKRYELIDAAYAIPVGVVLGLVSIFLARGARRRLRRSVVVTRGAGAARVGRLIGLAGFLLAVTAAMAVGVYAVLAAVDY
jgi:NhaP-type Na+/H+ or K+/H+ antiporter